MRLIFELSVSTNGYSEGDFDTQSKEYSRNVIVLYILLNENTFGYLLTFNNFLCLRFRYDNTN